MRCSREKTLPYGEAKQHEKPCEEYIETPQTRRQIYPERHICVMEAYFLKIVLRAKKVLNSEQNPAHFDS
jgi:hypothetical protein